MLNPAPINRLAYMKETTQDRLVRARKEAKLSQSAVADRVGMSQPTYSELERGLSRTSGKLVEIARVLGVDPTWLATGKGSPKAPSAEVEPGPSIKGRLPLISWVQAGEWCEAVDNFEPGDAEEWLPCPYDHSDSAFCLTVVGQSMAPDYREGEIIAVDPTVEPRHGSDVVCRTPDNKVTFKRLQITPEGTYLLALNPDWPDRMIQAPEDTHICGVVIASWMDRR